MELLSRLVIGSVIGLAMTACTTRSHDVAPTHSPAGTGTSTPAWLHDAEAWPRLSKALVGTWRSAEGLVLESSLISRDSALVERWVMPSGGETINVFHPDGDGLMVTHYCAQGNQARLRATSASAEGFVFEGADVTNLAPGGSALCRLEVRPSGDTLLLREVYCPGDGTAQEIVLHRVAP